jgi:hypothetical protein
MNPFLDQLNFYNPQLGFININGSLGFWMTENFDWINITDFNNNLTLYNQTKKITN